jgi:hypothetical protein
MRQNQQASIPKVAGDCLGVRGPLKRLAAAGSSFDDYQVLA